MTSKAKRLEQETGHKEIDRLFTMAREKAIGEEDGTKGAAKSTAKGESAAKDKALADRYVAIARKLSSRSRVSLRRYNRVHCRKCCVYFTGATVRVRTRARPNPVVVYTCLACGHMTRIPKTRVSKRSRSENGEGIIA